MNTNLSPKDLALVIGVSESSLKRWVDMGKLRAARTAGGHRRIPLHEAVRFIRHTSQEVKRPDLLGLPDLSDTMVEATANGQGERVLEDALTAGNAELARGLIMAQFLTDRSVASVCDGPIAHAMNRIGELWRHDERGVFIEHRATDICVQALHQIRLTLDTSGQEHAPVAVGGAISGDPTVIPTLMASTVLLELGYRDVNLGANTPADAMLRAAQEYRAELVWVSVSYHRDPKITSQELTELAEGISKAGGRLVLGGRGLCGMQLPHLPDTSIVSSMSELAALARTAKARRMNGTVAQSNGKHH